MSDNGSSGGGMKILEIYARNFERLPLSMNLLIAFGVIFVMSMVAGAREPASVAVISGTLLLAYLAVLVPNRRLFRLSADTRRLVRFVGMPGPRGRIRFFIASFEKAETQDLSGEVFRYVSLARNDVEAMIEVVAVLARHGLLEETHNILELLVDEKTARDARVDCLVYIGGPRVSSYVSSLLISDPIVSLETDEDSGALALVADAGPARRYTMLPPSPRTRRTVEDTWTEPTYGCVMKRSDPAPVRFAIWGLDARGTVAAAHWLGTHWARLSEDYDIDLDESFTAILEVPRQEARAARPKRVPVDGSHPLLLPDLK